MQYNNVSYFPMQNFIRQKLLCFRFEQTVDKSNLKLFQNLQKPIYLFHENCQKTDIVTGIVNSLVHQNYKIICKIFQPLQLEKEFSSL